MEIFFLFHYESEWIGKIKNIDHHLAGRFGHVHRFIDDLTAMNDNKEFEKSFKVKLHRRIRVKD